ncbi:MAG TPA: succinate dehydrogenase/fumarate reductase flavoprotein subunit [bacterium]|nr:succinate dehydrogenase/fumarate reductase flavoprotein subunit [bacterium]HPN44492.1 succinate dehydrogenase/fumarate reductase flavoprotein subunit [bacterium]
MHEIISHDLVIFGAGLAGIRAAIEAAREAKGDIDIAVVTKNQMMRAHSVAAEGGTAAVMRMDKGDSYELHAWDTVKGSDFLADQDVVDRFVRIIPDEILQLDHWGIPWTRLDDGKIAQRPFGGHSYPRAVLAADKTGFFELQTLYDTLTKYEHVTHYNEFFITAIIVEGGEFRGLTAINMTTGKFVFIRAKGLIIASGGGGTLFGFTTYSQTVTGDGMALAYRAGLPLEDMEFLQFHPTGLVPSGILMTEACRGEGGYLLNNKGERFMEQYAPEKKELAPRDMVSRSEIMEIEKGNGFKGPNGLDYIHLDLRHLGADKINDRLPLIREVCLEYNDIDPIHEPIPCRPVAHYSMGGVETDIDGATRIPGIWVAGEAACVSLHGANRLGSNSTAECLVWGKITGALAAQYCKKVSTLPAFSEQTFIKEQQRVLDLLRNSNGTENLYQLRRELRTCMDMNMGVFRNKDGMEEALKIVRELQVRYKNIQVQDKALAYNTNLIHALELQNLLDLAEVTVTGGLVRTESRGAHARRDFAVRDDENWLKHTLAFYSAKGPELSYKPVNITTWKPVERKY